MNRMCPGCWEIDGVALIAEKSLGQGHFKGIPAEVQFLEALLNEQIERGVMLLGKVDDHLGITLVGGVVDGAAH